MASRSDINANQRKQEIVTLAAELFRQEGFHQTSMERLALKAGIAKPTLYHYFSGKDEILHEIHQAFIVPLIERHERRLRNGLSPVQLLLEVMGDILELMQTHAGHVRVFFENHRELAPEHRSLVVEQRAYYQSLVHDAIVEGQKQGQFRVVDPEIATLSLFGMCNWAYQWYRSDRHGDPRAIAYTMWNLLGFGLLPRQDVDDAHSPLVASPATSNPGSTDER